MNDSFSLSPGQASNLRFMSRSQPGSTAVTVNIHQATATDFGGETHEYYVEPSAPETVKSVGILHPVGS